jgi:cell division protein YceG involved in septum cleavage
MYNTRKAKVQVPYIFLGKVTCILVIMVALFLIVLFILPKKTASANNTPYSTYTITSVQIEEGDSLWSIATEHYTEEFSSITNYIAEIKRMNGISTDTLYAGSYILVPQYVLN